MSDNIFAEIYNRILSLFGQSVKDESKNTAVNRLRLVLMQDRTNLTPEIMNRMRSELISVLSKYVELDQEALDLNIGQEGEQMALMLSIPVIRAKDEAEIEEALKKEEEKTKEVDCSEDIAEEDLNEDAPEELASEPDSDSVIDKDSDSDCESEQEEIKPSADEGELQNEETSAEVAASEKPVSETKKIPTVKSKKENPAPKPENTNKTE